MEYRRSNTKLCVLLLVILSIVLVENIVVGVENTDENEQKMVEKIDKINIEACQWRLFYEFSLMSTSSVKILPVEKPKSFHGGENKQTLFKSCFRGIRELLRTQWKSYESVRVYMNKDLKENLIRIGKERRISPPKTIQEGKLIFQDVKQFCAYVTKRYFELLKDSNDVSEILGYLCSKPVRKKMTRLMLPKDVRSRGEGILSSLEEIDQMRIEEEDRYREDIEKIKRGELIPSEESIPIHEVLQKYSKDNPLLEVSQYVENKSFYKNWLNRDEALANKIKNLPNPRESMLLKEMFGINEARYTNGYYNNKSISSLNSNMVNELNFTLPENWEEIQNIKLNKTSYEKYEDQLLDLNQKRLPEYREMVNRNLNYIQDSKLLSGEQFDPVKSLEKELGTGIFRNERVVKNKPGGSGGPIFYYRRSRDSPRGTVDANGKNVPLIAGGDIVTHNGRVFRRLYNAGPAGELNIRNPDLLVPLDEVYEVPKIFQSDYNPGNFSEAQTKGHYTPSGFDQFGLLSIPHKERRKKQLEAQISSTSGNIMKDYKGNLEPLKVEYPPNSRVFYINVAGLRKEIPGYDLNPEPVEGLHQDRDPYYNKNEELEKILKDFLKSIEAKKKKNRLSRYGGSKFVKSKTMQSEKSPHHSQGQPRSDNIVKNAGFLPLKNDPEGLKNQITEEPIRSNQAQKESVFKATNIYDENEGSKEEESYKLETNRRVRFQPLSNNDEPKKKYVSPPPKPISEEDEDLD